MTMFVAYVTLILGTVVIALGVDSTRRYRVTDTTVERNVLCFTRRLRVDEITQAFVHNDGWGSGSLVIRGRRFADNIVIPMSTIAKGNTGAVAVLGRLREAARNGARVAEDVLSLEQSSLRR